MMESIRNSDGLLTSVNYKRKPNGKIDWRAMITPEYLVINSQFEEELVSRFGKPLAQIKTEELEDKYLLILLGGIKELALLRGYLDVDPTPVLVSDTKCVVKTRILWMGNFETGGQAVWFGDMASASHDNVKQSFHPYLETIACNRAFVRAVRNFLGITIVGNDEVRNGHTVSTESASASSLNSDPSHIPVIMLRKAAEEKKLTFDHVKLSSDKKYKAKLESNPSDWTGYESIPKRDCLTLIEIIKSSK